MENRSDNKFEVKINLKSPPALLAVIIVCLAVFILYNDIYVRILFALMGFAYVLFVLSGVTHEEQNNVKQEQQEEVKPEGSHETQQVSTVRNRVQPLHPNPEDTDDPVEQVQVKEEPEPEQEQVQTEAEEHEEMTEEELNDFLFF